MNTRKTHVLERAGRNRLKLEEAAIVVQRRALILVCPWESRASLDDSCVCVYSPPVVVRKKGREGGSTESCVEIDEGVKHPTLVA